MGRSDGYGKRFAKAIAVRAVKTFCQAMVGSIGTTAVLGGVDWRMALSTAALSTLVSILMSVSVGLPEVKMPELEDIDLDEHV